MATCIEFHFFQTLYIMARFKKCQIDSYGNKEYKKTLTRMVQLFSWKCQYTCVLLQGTCCNLMKPFQYTGCSFYALVNKKTALKRKMQALLCRHSLQQESLQRQSSEQAAPFVCTPPAILPRAIVQPLWPGRIKRPFVIQMGLGRRGRCAWGTHNNYTEETGALTQA